MRITSILPVVIWTPLVLLALATAGFPGRCAAQPDARFVPYSPDPEHLWNRLHQALFVRTGADGSRHVHSTDPLLYRGGTFLLDGNSHRQAITLLDEYLATAGNVKIDGHLQRLFFQRDLWAAFDYVAWYPDDWVFKSEYAPAAIALRNRLASAIGRLALSEAELATLPDNYARAVASRQYAGDHDPQHPEVPFLPADLLESAGPWVRIHVTTPGQLMAPKHFDGSGGRAVHVVFIRLPGGRTVTEQYLKSLQANAVRQFLPGTMVAMVRRALAVNTAAAVHVTPITELVQIRVYRRIPKEREANLHGDFGEQDSCEFVLDRSELLAGRHGLRAVDPQDPATPLFDRHESSDPFERIRVPLTPNMPQLKTCIECHQAPGVYSVLSITNPRGELRGSGPELFRTYGWDIEMNNTLRAKVSRFDWGLLQGKLEATLEHGVTRNVQGRK